MGENVNSAENAKTLCYYMQINTSTNSLRRKKIPRHTHTLTFDFVTKNNNGINVNNRAL